MSALSFAPAVLPPEHPLRNGMQDSPLVAAAMRRPGPRPVWFMRQAGRSLPEYRSLRDGVPMLQACFDAALIAEITLQPVRRHHVDAAILFSDIVVPLKAMGVDLDIAPGVGPVVAQPFSSMADLARLPGLDPGSVAAVTQGARMVAASAEVPLIGFAGAPFTLASYLIEGGPSRTHAKTKALMHSQPGLWHELAARLAAIAAQFLRLQILAGASAVQLFDSWAGSLSLADYRRFVLPHSRTVLESIADLPVPRIHFGVGTGELLGAMGEPPVEVVGVDYRVDLRDASARVGPQRALQGNLDPALLGAEESVLRAEVERIVRQGDELPGHIFNLGHGVPPQTDPDVLTRIVDWVHELRP